VSTDWFGEFFSTLDDALYALWQFGDPSGVGQGWWGLVILVIWGVGLIGLPLFIARQTYEEHEWVSATMGVVAALSVGWWIFGILPSAWIYYLDSASETLKGPIIPESVGITLASGYRLDLMSNFYDVFRDLVVVLQQIAALALTFWGALRIQKRFPRTLAPGETRPEAGGYK
jgi:hypothetical protein